MGRYRKGCVRQSSANLGVWRFVARGKVWGLEFGLNRRFRSVFGRAGATRIIRGRHCGLKTGRVLLAVSTEAVPFLIFPTTAHRAKFYGAYLWRVPVFISALARLSALAFCSLSWRTCSSLAAILASIASILQTFQPPIGLIESLKL